MSTAFAPQEKLLHHADRLAAFVADDWRAPPVQVEISPTNACNAKCPWCFFVAGEYKQRHSQEELSLGHVSNLLYDLHQMGSRAVTWTGGGDPSVYSGIDAAIDCAADLGLKQGIFTNAYKPLKHPEKLAWIRVTVTERFVITKHVARYAAATKVGVNFNLTAENERHLMPMVEAARDAGVRYFQVRPALADRWDLQQPVSYPAWLKDFETETFRVVLTPYKFADYERPHGYPVCHGHRLVPFVWHNGDVAVCAYHFSRPAFTFGNLKEQGFREIWHGDRRRSMLAAGVKVIPDCQHCCKLHEVNKALASIRGEFDRPEDVEFV